MMPKHQSAGTGEGHLPASEAGSDRLEKERNDADEVGTPASEEDGAAKAGEGDLDEGRPGRGGPGAFPPPD